MPSWVVASNPSDRCLLLNECLGCLQICDHPISVAIISTVDLCGMLSTWVEKCVANLLMMTCMFPVGNIPVIIPDYSMPTHSCEPTVCARYCPQFRCRRVLRSGAGYRDARKSCRAIPHTSSGGLAQPTRILSLYKCLILYRA